MIRRVLLLLLLLPAAFLVACGGGSSGESATATPGPGQTAAPTQSPATTPGLLNTPTAAAQNPFRSLSAYRYDMKVSSELEQAHFTGAFKAPDGNQLYIFVSGSDQPAMSVVVLGDNAWVKKQAASQWTQTTVAQAGVQGLFPQYLLGSIPFDDLANAGKDLGEEDVAGVPAHHFQISSVDQQMLSGLAVILGGPPQSFSMEVWRANDGGWPAKATIDMTYTRAGQTINAHIDWLMSDVNSSTISIVPPS
jgi:hypothetical protein